jgi:hypothetical protein
MMLHLACTALGVDHQVAVTPQQIALAGLELKRRFLVEAVEEVGVEGLWVRQMKPRPQYATLFALDRAERFGGDFCRLAPRIGASERAA